MSLTKNVINLRQYRSTKEHEADDEITLLESFGCNLKPYVKNKKSGGIFHVTPLSEGATRFTMTVPAHIDPIDFFIQNISTVMMQKPKSE